MKIDINCSNCKYKQHSGAFTPGGAKLVCTGPNCIEHFTKGTKAEKEYKRIQEKVNRLKHKYGKLVVNYDLEEELVYPESLDEYLDRQDGICHWKFRTVKLDGSILRRCPLLNGETY